MHLLKATSHLQQRICHSAGMQNFIGRANQRCSQWFAGKSLSDTAKMGTGNELQPILVMNSGQYDLSTPYDKIFREEGENSKESVFEVQATASATIPTANGVQYAQIRG